jgi:hypothetical protein
MIEPETPEQWQEAVNAAEFMLALDLARQYGLIETDIRLDVERCDDILRRGKEKGFVPASVEELCRRFIGATV